MEKQTLSRVGLLVVFLLIIVGLMLFWPAMIRLNLPRSRVICGTNLKGLGNAMLVYANDYDGRYPCLPGSGEWSKDLGFPFYITSPKFQGSWDDVPRTISASWYLLVRQADVSPRSFVCPQSKQTEFTGENPKNLDLVELWDFGPDPYSHVSYVMHNPYGRYPADDQRSAAFAVAADMSPWMKEGDFVSANPNPQLPPQIIQWQNPAGLEKGNSLNHTEYEKKLFIFRITRNRACGFGQNVLFADGHSSFEKQPNVGVQNDNIYTYWSAEEDPGEQDIQGGTAPTGRSPENDAKSEDDSFLVI